MLKYRWSWKSTHIGLLLQKKIGDFWTILWNDGQNLSVEEYHVDSIVEIGDHDLEKASSRWNIASS